MDAARLRSFWFQRQGLPRRLPADAERVLDETGWLHTAGGQLPYLSLHARSGLARAEVDAAVAAGRVYELPSVRGCTMLVPAKDVPLALHVARAQHEKSELGVARKHCGVTDKELDKLCGAIVLRLAAAPLEPKELHQQLGDKLVRSLGEAGKKRGFGTTLPLALGRLQIEGEVRRISTTGRLDTQRYRYALWRPNPLGKKKLDEREASHQLARRYFRWFGPATVQEFAWWAGVGVKLARAITAELELDVVDGEDRLLAKEDNAAFARARASREPQLSWVPFRDNYSALRRDLSSIFDAEHADRLILDWGAGTVALGRATSLHQPAILDRGQLIGVWDYDDRDTSLFWHTFDKPGRSLRDALEAEMTLLLPFIRDQLGDARYYSLDSEKNRRQRLDALRAMV